MSLFVDEFYYFNTIIDHALDVFQYRLIKSVRVSKSQLKILALGRLGNRKHTYTKLPLFFTWSSETCHKVVTDGAIFT